MSDSNDIPDFVQLSKVPVNYEMNLETDLLEPVTDSPDSLFRTRVSFIVILKFLLAFNLASALIVLFLILRLALPRLLKRQFLRLEIKFLMN